MGDIPQWMNIVITVIPSFCTGVATVLYTRWRYIRSRQFSTVSDEKRFKTLKKIGELEKKGNNFHKESMIKTLYESIGMFFPHRYNCYLLNYVNEAGIPYQDKNFNHFLNSTALMNSDLQLNLFVWNEKKSFWRLAELWVTFIALTIMLLPASFIILKTASQASEGKDILSYILSGLPGGAWTFLYVGFLRSTQNCIGAKKFYTLFAPWLQQRMADEKK
ncbi:hypothetical protein ACGVWS_04125 [Enterobacteriaceae bacterium LUAb1]